MTIDELWTQPTDTSPPAEALAVSIAVEYADRVNFAMQQNGVALVERIRLTNTGESRIENIEVEIALDSGECDTWSGRVARIEPEATYNLEPAGLHLNTRTLAARTEAERTTLRVRVTAGDRVASTSVPVELLAFDEWPGVGLYPELLAAFVTPNHPRIADLLGPARQSLGDLSGRDALDGYQSDSRQRAVQIAEACFNAVHPMDIGYINPPASFERTGQRVRLVDRILREKLGSCLDLSLLLAGLWEQAGLHPVVLLPEGHAMAAVWTHESHLPEPAIDEAARVRNLIELGELVPVESTVLTQPGATFAAAVETAKQKMGSSGAGFCAVDVRAGRKRGVRPLPLRVDGDDTRVDVEDLEAAAPAPATTRLDRVALAERADALAEATEASATPGDGETGGDRIERWKARLLDLSLRNRLINFRETGRTVRLLTPEVSRLEDMLAEDRSFTVHSRPDSDDAHLLAELEAGRLFTSEPPAETAKRLLQLYRLARSSVEETGANLLHLALGMLRWYENEKSSRPHLAPLILLPVRLDRRSTGSGYRYDLSLSNEPLRPNVTLLEKLRVEFGMATSGLDDLPEDERGLDVQLILRNFRSAIRDSSRWEVEESAFLGLFSFNKFLMWRDLQENMGRLRRNRLVVHLVDRADSAFDPRPFPRPEDLDDEVEPGALLCTRDADSTQLAAVQAAADGRTFVLEGPPGTGKSQTIANIIADSLGRGKRVLFVAEKMAALSVVSRRLEQDGLGPFCLELHSAKASKKEVLTQLGQALDAAVVGEPKEWDSLCSELGVTRRELNTYVRELHEPRTSGESLFRVLGRLSLLEEGPRIAPETDDVSATTPEQLEGWRRQVAQLVERSAAVDPPAAHPLRGIGRTEWSFSLPAEMEAALAPARSARDQLAAGLRTFVEAAGVTDDSATRMAHPGVQATAVIANLLQDTPVPERALLDCTDAAVIAGLGRLIGVGRERDDFRRALLESYREEFLEIDHLVPLDRVNRALSHVAPIRLVTGLLARRALRPYCPGRVPSLETLRADLETARSVKRATAELSGSGEAALLFGRRWNDGAGDWDELESVLAWCDRFREAAAVLTRDPRGSALVAPLAGAACDSAAARSALPAARGFVKAWNEWRSVWKHLKQLLETSSAEAFVDDAEIGWLAGIDRTLGRWAGAVADMNDWCAWRRVRRAAADQGLTTLVESFEQGELTRETLGPALERGYGHQWFTAVANGVDAIRQFNATAHGRTIDRFRTVDADMIARTRSTVTARLGRDRPTRTGQVSAQSEMGVLRRELEKKRRHLPTRRLIEAMPNLLPRLKPCFLMSPLSVAQYLDAKLPPFDIVVFDEASQIPVWDAIGAIARGAEVVVVGDSKQLPPTSFFNTLDGEDDLDPDDDVVDDMESILKECNASGIPPMRLLWHYRSRHESLIAFSNHHYYDNSLHTFPSPAERSAALGVTFRHVADGVYDRGGSRTNRIEADAVVEEIVQRLGRDDATGSIGVVTFNLAQQGLIEDLLDEQRRANPRIERFFTREVSEPVFVKNLENVQGDERDTVIFSIGYGPDQAGRRSMNFGPLNKEGGERRLNVAITRARERLIVFSSMRSDEIDLRRTRALGVRHFKTFLDYADRGPQAIAEAIDYSGTREFESGFEQAVWKSLTERGWDVDTQVGCAGYRVDLAVRDAEQPGRYLIGIECDGASYHSARTARDRDRLRHSVLEGLGWRIERVWSTDWWIHPDRCVEALEHAIDEARRGVVAKPAEVEPPVAPGAVAAMPGGGEAGHVAEPTASVDSGDVAEGPDGPVPYRCARPTGPPVGDLDEASSIRGAASLLAEIVTVEGPIVEELALRRLAELIGVTRVTQRVRGRLDEIKAAAMAEHAIRLVDDALWPEGLEPAGFRLVRVPGPDGDDRRSLEEIPLAERVNAVVHVLDVQFGLPHEELERETARLLGWPLTTRASELIRVAIESAIAQGRAEGADGRVCIPSDRT